MKTVGVFEAKNKLSELLNLVENGESVLLTRNGRPVAELVPVAHKETKADTAMKWILSRRWTLGGIASKDLVDAGRRF